ncbi:hypothetical protein DPMN_042356 [Dreissena polymorpha]|uniref:Uncharacterized protein n=1 Tax=Dreissena polymorpha TaxID=45954 RepID=A0A9D4D1W7_DREPO|nr:hypothetical protein DPMN_042356 [Dreissena polymorpha]
MRIQEEVQHGYVEDHGEQQEQHQCRYHNEVTSFIWFWLTLSKNGISTAEVRLNIAMVTAASQD